MLIFIYLCNITSILKLELLKLLASSYSDNVQSNRSMYPEHKGHISCQCFFIKQLGGILILFQYSSRGVQ